MKNLRTTTLAIAAQERWHVEPGQLWELPSRTVGRDHRLLCGDSGDPAQVARLLGGVTCPTLLFDPDWSRNERPSGDHIYDSILAFSDGQWAASIIRLFGAPTWVFVWDGCASWVPAGKTPRPLKRMKLCLWYGDVSIYTRNGWRLPWGKIPKPTVIRNSRGNYSYQPNPAGKQLADLFQAPLPQLRAAVGHPHSKPAEWLAMLIGNCSRGGVYDPYSGAGTGLIACEMVGGRPCRAMEIEPHWVALTLQRYEDTFGITPRLVQGAGINNAA